MFQVRRVDIRNCPYARSGVAVVARLLDWDGASELLLWADPSFARYFWGTLITVGTALGGGVRIDEPTRA